MIILEHTDECKTLNAAYFQRWPNACRACNGTGVYAAAPSAHVRVVKTGADGAQKIQLVDGVRCLISNCDRCRGFGDQHGLNPLCPRCSRSNKFWLESARRHEPCEHCGWNDSDKEAAAPAAVCNCSDFYFDQKIMPGVGKVYSGKKK